MFNSFGTGPFAFPSTGDNLIVSSNLTLSGDLIVGNLIITDGIVLSTNGYRIFCNNLSLIGGTIKNNGAAGTPTAKGAGAPWGTVSGGANGGDNTNVEIPTAAGNIYVGGIGGAGGLGGGSGGAGGVSHLDYNHGQIFDDSLEFGGSILHPSLLNDGRFTPSHYYATLPQNPSTEAKVYTVAGGGGGGWGRANPTYTSGGGGGGGGGGGVVFIGCNGAVSLEGSSTHSCYIMARGGTGGDGDFFTPSGEGGPTVQSSGGGGGGGGAIIISCNSMSLKKGIISIDGGVGGSGTGSPAEPGAVGYFIVRTPNITSWSADTLVVGPSDTPVLWPAVSSSF